MSCACAIRTASAPGGEETARAIDAEVRAAVTAAYERGRAVLRERLQVLHRIAERVLDRETLERAELEAIVRAEGAPARDACRRGAARWRRGGRPRRSLASMRADRGMLSG
ncbi:hypothetical protein [Sorangium sp. So ce406]|uniref:hypothetical protein n=1 Tax=Sorangium sp. So ce406 TaxID=3133311 RepID=UPI003F5B60C1